MSMPVFIHIFNCQFLKLSRQPALGLSYLTLQLTGVEALTGGINNIGFK